MGPYYIEVIPLSEYNWTLSREGPFPFNPAVLGLIAGFYGTAIWMAIELQFQVYFTFKRHRGLYFWAIVVTAIGVALHALGFLLKQFDHQCPKLLAVIISKIGWMCNVTGFATVLYSRLHLVVRNRLILRLVLAMIITNVIILHVPLNTTEFGLWFTSKDSPKRAVWEHVMQIVERIQITGFTLQENIISSIYIYQTRKFLRAGYSGQTHKVIWLFIATQLVALTFDMCLVVCDYKNMFYLKVTIHPFAYAVKLRLEFIVLNELLNLIRYGMVPGNFPAPDDHDNDHDTEAALPQFPAGPQVRNTIFSDKTWGGDRNRNPVGAANGRNIPNIDEIMHTQEYDVDVSWGQQYPNNPSFNIPLHLSQAPTRRPEMASRSGSGALTPNSTLRVNSDASTLAAIQSGHDSDSNSGKASLTNSFSETERRYLGRSFPS